MSAKYLSKIHENKIEEAHLYTEYEVGFYDPVVSGLLLIISLHYFFLKCHHKHNHNNSSGCGRLFEMLDSVVSIVTQSISYLIVKSFWDQKIA